MITQLPTTPEAYSRMFKQLAEWHINIEHNEESAKRFVVINESMVNPFRGIDLGELLQAQKSRLSLKSAKQSPTEPKVMMALINWASDLKTPSTRPYTLVDGAFLILGKVTKDDWEERTSTMQMAYSTGREIISWVQQFFYLNSNILKIGDVMEDPVGPFTNENLYGYRFDFEIEIEQALSHQNSNFGDNAPARL
jgi:hypothetical protein